eukprot:3033897-Rhodomonas_salina.2
MCEFVSLKRLAKIPGGVTEMPRGDFRRYRVCVLSARRVCAKPPGDTTLAEISTACGTCFVSVGHLEGHDTRST